ncbi:hypothetical protein GJ744_011964 [Endocarpon pusillum]|uniref:Uncharacterized protein n=1 Tax=Endocarpon pusillum TaxID=364733 RepID=A0A8H7EAM4_9EURO|nr:hypothetical protein GJ744_011964 [Endocarpon pusillum]
MENVKAHLIKINHYFHKADLSIPQPTHNPSTTMLFFLLTPVVLLLLNANAAPTALLPMSPTLDTAGQIVEARADRYPDWSCEAKAAYALNKYNYVKEVCDDSGIRAFFRSECYYGPPKNCCPEDKQSKSCKKFWLR